MEILIDLQIEALDEGGFLATSSDLQGFLAQGRTYAETIEIAQDVARKLIESYLEHGDALPDKIKAQFAHPNREITLKIPVAISQ
ncbi:MAG: type II toxin-antitoxin system HicB family antitoxin [Chloroherpetonaceae bacterium]|nr:type II toxin-antitoxin system HicB family antitoxin [Chloroherpetonaceae bacterium]